MVAAMSSYQGGPFVDVFSSSGSNPLINCKLAGEKGIQKVYEKSVKGYIYSLTGAASKLQLPKDERKSSLHFLQQFLVLQIYVPAGQHFALELGVTDGSGFKRKLYFSTAFHEVKTTPLQCQVPLTALERDGWLNLAFDLVDLFGACFRGLTYRSLDHLILGSVCRLRKIFTVRQQPIDSSDSSFAGEPLPSSLDYPTGVQYRTQVLNASRVRESLPGAAAKRVSEEPSTAKAGPKRLSEGGMHVAFGSRTPAPAPLLVVSANVDVSQRGIPEEGEGTSRSGKRAVKNQVPAEKLKAPLRGPSGTGSVASFEKDDGEAGEEWSPTENRMNGQSKEKAPMKKQAVPVRAAGKPKLLVQSKPKGEKAKGTGEVAARKGEGSGPPKKEAAKKVAVRTESPVTAWGNGGRAETPEESLLASMNADWKTTVKRELSGVEHVQSRTLAAEEVIDGSSSGGSSRASLQQERRTVREEALSQQDASTSQPEDLAQPASHGVSGGGVGHSQAASPTGSGLDARDVLAELERELAGLTAGTKNSPRAALWHSELDGFSRSSSRGSVRKAGGGTMTPRASSVSGRTETEPPVKSVEKCLEESEVIREEKLWAVSALEQWDEGREERGVNEHLEMEDGFNEHIGEEEESLGNVAGVNERFGGDDGVNEPFRADDGVNEHFEVHHEAAKRAGVSGSEDAWRSRRSNSRYSQESDDSDVTPRAPREKQCKEWGEANGGNDGQGNRRLVVRDSVEGESSVVLERTVTDWEERSALAETRRPSIDWEAEDDERSSLGSLEGSEWEASLSSERRTFRERSARKGLSSRDSGVIQGPVDDGGCKARSSSASRPTSGVLAGVDSVSHLTDRLQTVRRRSGSDKGAQTRRNSGSRRTSEVETSLSEWKSDADVGIGVARGGGSGRASRSKEQVPVRVSAGSAKRGGNGERLAEDDGAGGREALERRPKEVNGRASQSHMRASAGALKASARADGVSISQRASTTVLDATMRLEDMDLLFDPILKCFYDPKTNKYYELKEEDESLT